MPSASWSSPPTTRGLLVALLVAPLFLSLCQATCENQDYYLPQRLTLVDAPVLVPEVRDITHPYRGLNSLDYQLSNTGLGPASYGLAVSACRRCTKDQDCGSPTEIDQDGVRCDSERFFCRAGEEPDPCLLPATRGPIRLEPGDSVNGRFSEADLGLGDHVHLEFLCLPDEETGESPCSGTLDFILLLRQVECRSDGDCGSGEICDSQMGVCRAQLQPEEGCTIMVGRTGPGAILASLLLGIWAATLARRNRSRRAIR